MNCTKEYQVAITAPATDYLWWKMEEANGNRIDSINGKILVPGLTGAATLNSAAGKILLGANAVVSLGEVAFLDMPNATGLPYVTGNGWTLVGWFNWTGLNETTTLFGVFSNTGAYWAQAQGFPIGNFFIKSSDPAGNTATPIPPNGWNFFILEFVPSTGKLRWEINRNGTVTELAVNQPANGSPIDVFLDFYGTTMTVPATESWIWDEIGFFPINLTVAQKDYLYNAGAGRTSPIVLP